MPYHGPFVLTLWRGFNDPFHALPRTSKHNPRRSKAFKRAPYPQTHDFKAFTANAFTTVCAAFAFTLTSLPNAMRLPAFLAGLCLVLIMQMPGIVNLPVPLVSFSASSAKASKTLVISDLFFSHAVAKASAMPLFGMDFTPFFALMAFIAFIAFFAMMLSGLRISKGIQLS